MQIHDVFYIHIHTQSYTYVSAQLSTYIIWSLEIHVHQNGEAVTSLFSSSGVMATAKGEVAFQPLFIVYAAKPILAGSTIYFPHEQFDPENCQPWVESNLPTPNIQRGRC